MFHRVLHVCSNSGGCEMVCVFSGCDSRFMVLPGLGTEPAPAISTSGRALKGCFWREVVIPWRQTITQAKQHPTAPLTHTLNLFWTFNLFSLLVRTHCKWRWAMSSSNLVMIDLSPVTCRNPETHQPRRECQRCAGASAAQFQTWVLRCERSNPDC